MDSGAHHLSTVLVRAPALPSALVALHFPVVAVLIAAGNVHPCKDPHIQTRSHFLNIDTLSTHRCLILMLEMSAANENASTL